MNKSSTYIYVIIWASIGIALVGQSIPWPEFIETVRPNWVVLVICYWAMALPHRVNVGIGLIAGLLWDLMNGSVLGVHGLAMSLVAYVVAINFQLLRNMAIWHQALVVTALAALVRLIEYVGQFTIGNLEFNGMYFLGSLINLILWPWIFFLLRRIRRRWNLN